MPMMKAANRLPAVASAKPIASAAPPIQSHMSLEARIRFTARTDRWGATAG